MRLLACAALALATTAPRVALAKPCALPDLVAATPPDGAEGVPTNAALSAHYQLSAEYLGEDVVLEHVGKEKTTLTATFDANEGMLRVSPTLIAGEPYVLHWPGLRGIGTATLGRGADVRFTAGHLTDQAAPQFGGASGVAWDASREKDDCTDSLEDRYVFDLSLAPAADDGGRGSLTLLVFQTKGPTIDPGSPEPVSISGMPPAGETIRVVRTPDQSVGEVCFAAVVRDLTGKASASGNRETCVTTVATPFFEGCALGRRGSTGRRALTLAYLMLAAAALARSRARARA